MCAWRNGESGVVWTDCGAGVALQKAIQKVKKTRREGERKYLTMSEWNMYLSMCVIACAGFRSEWNVCMCVRKRRGECISDDEGFFPVRVCVYVYAGRARTMSASWVR